MEINLNTSALSRMLRRYNVKYKLGEKIFYTLVLINVMKSSTFVIKDARNVEQFVQNPMDTLENIALTFIEIKINKYLQP